MTWTGTVPTLYAGFVPDADDFTTMVDALTFLSSPPRMQARQTVAQSLTSGVFSAITCTTEDYDQDPNGTSTQHDTVTNPSRFTALFSGRYTLSGAVGFAASATGRRLTKWQVNGVDVNGSGLAIPATAASVGKIPAVTIDVLLAVGDYVELLGAQESGGALNTAVGGATDQSFMKVLWIAFS